MSPRKSIIALLTLSVLVLLSAPAVMAQNIVTGDLIGTVTDQTGAVVSGANVTLKSVTAKEVIEVTAEPPLLQTENANITTTYSTKQIDLLPNPGNDLTYIAQTSPG